MNTPLRGCGFVLLAAMLLSAQDVPAVPSENLENTVANRSVPFVDLLREAEAGNASAQYSVANAYAIGSVVPKNGAEAVRWWLQAARNGFAKAQNRMGYLYQHGMGVPRDYAEAVRWSALRQSKNCQKHSTTWLRCINRVRVYNGTTLTR